MIFTDFELAWMNDLHRKGYAFEGRHDVYKPRDIALPAGRGHRFRPTLFKAEDSDTNFMADITIDWLKERRNKDWFLHCVFLRPHPPVVAPEPYNALYNPADVPFPRPQSHAGAGKRTAPLSQALDRLFLQAGWL